jgi:RNA-binding protein
VTVTTPSSPKKQSLMPPSRLRKSLRAAGHHLSPVVQVGKEGVTPAVLKQLDEALLAHELVKVKVGSESPEDRFEAAARVAAGPGMSLAQLLGRTLLVYRKHPTKPKFEAAPRPEKAAPVRGLAPRAPVVRKHAPRERTPRERTPRERTPRERTPRGRPVR